jgi:hypothetical protein
MLPLLMQFSVDYGLPSLEAPEILTLQGDPTDTFEAASVQFLAVWLTARTDSPSSRKLHTNCYV